MNTFFIIYKTTCLINGKQYIGQHITNDLDDGYLGSGTVLRRAIKLHGKENFSRDILYIFDNFDEMNEKERELVNEEIIADDNYYNVILGGKAWDCTNTLGVIDKETGVRMRIHKDLYNKDKNRYEKFSKGKTTVYDNTLGKHIQVQSSDYDPTKHKRSFGGIVVEVDGKRQYMSRDDYENSNIKTHTYGMVTVVDLSDNKSKHVSKEEFHSNRHNYKSITEGYVTGRHKVTNEKRRFSVNDITEDVKAEYNFTTTNQITVKVKETGLYINVSKEEYKNNRDLYLAQTENFVIAFDVSDQTKLSKKYSLIPKGEYDNTIHKLPKDIKFDLFDGKGDLIFSYWGTIRSLKDIIFSSYGYKPKVTSKCLNVLIDDPKSPFFGSTIIIYDWKKDYGLSD